MSEQEQIQPSKSSSPLREIWDWVWPIAIGIAVAEVIIRWVFSFAQVPTGSMYPTIPVNPPDVPSPAYILVDHLATEFGQPYRGEVVLFPFPDDPKQIFVKRIIGLPGDTVTIHGGHVYINGRMLKEPYLNTSWGQMTGSFGPYVVPKNDYFMLGDNRNDSADSRFWDHKFVPRSTIIGRADAVVWPLGKAHVIQR